MEENKIKYVTQKVGDIEEVMRVGSEGVELIKDCTMEFENGINYEFQAFDKDGKLLRSFINGTLDVRYF